jgi:hypothetical protein
LRNRVATKRSTGIGATLNAVSPLSTLARGYAIVTTVATGQVVRSDDYTPGAYGALLALLGDRVASSGGGARGLQAGLEVVGHVWPRGRSPGRRTEPATLGGGTPEWAQNRTRLARPAAPGLPMVT